MTPKEKEKTEFKQKITEGDIKKGIAFLKSEKAYLEQKIEFKAKKNIKNEIEHYFSLPKQNLEFFNNFKGFFSKFKKTYSIQVFDNKSFDDYIASKSLVLNNKIENGKRIEIALQFLKQNKHYFRDLEVEKVFNDQIVDFLFIILKELFKKINQNIYLCEQLNQNLLKTIYID